jgi:eukaryotic-like serine/threonine-protein kinase
MTETQRDPRVLGPYRIIAGLGMGGMARVYLALSQKPGFDKLFVLKLLREELVADAEFRSMFLNEARVAARLNHPNVVNTYEIGVDNDQHFIAMEYLEGQALSAIVARVGRKNMPLHIYLRVLCDVLAGLEYAHKLTAYDGTPLALVHRDVSPQNVFVTYPGLVKLVDFGIAKMAGSAVLTQEGVMKGKLGYMAPEQALAQPVDARADVFSVGVMLWEALAQSRFFPIGEGEAAVLQRRLTGDEKKVKDVNPAAPDELVTICEKAMALDRDNRYASAAELREALEGYLKRTTNADATDVGRFLEQHFEADRVKMMRLVEQQVKSGPTSAPLLMLTTFVPKDASPRPTERESDGAHLVETHEAPSGPSPRRKAPLIAMGVSVLGIGVIAAAALFGLPHKTSTPTTTAAPVTAEPTVTLPVAATAPDPKAVAPPASASAAPAKDGSVVITFEVSPPNARVMLDGKALEPPFEVKRPADGTPHRLDVTARGYAPQTRMITFDRDRAEGVALLRGGGGGYAAGKPAGAAAKGAPGAPPDPTDVDLNKEPRGKTKRPIDDQDPY